MARLFALPWTPNLVEGLALRFGSLVRRLRLGARRRREPPPLQPEAERLQDRGEFLAGAADDRHEFGHHPEAAVAGRSRRRRGTPFSYPEGDARADEIGQPFQHVDANRAGACDMEASGAPIGFGDKRASLDRSQALLQRNGSASTSRP
jgi:hypothetical protein